MTGSQVAPNASAMAGYQVTPEEVSAAATYVDNRAADIGNKINTLGSYVASLGEFWQGSAHQAFDTLGSANRDPVEFAEPDSTTVRQASRTAANRNSRPPLSIASASATAI